MKPSARVALIVALATTAPTWASLPFYSPDYTLDDDFEASTFSGGITPNGKAANTIIHYGPDGWDYLIATWRGQAPLPTPQSDSGHPNAQFGGMNRSGWICGSTEDPLTGRAQPALWSPDGSRIDLPLLPTTGDPQAVAYDVNDSGFAAGMSYKTYSQPRPVYWTPSGEIVELPNPFATSDQYWEGYATGISSTGIIIGSVWNYGAMKWDVNGTASPLSNTTDTGITYVGVRTSEVLDDGTILGFGSNNSGQTHYGIFWTPSGEAIDLRKLPNADSLWGREANAINNNHYSAGYTGISSHLIAATRWSPTGEPFALDHLPDAPTTFLFDQAYDINDFNFAVGCSSDNDTYHRAVLWTPAGDAIDFNSLIQSGDEWKPLSADKITNTGWIFGRAFFDPAGPAESYSRPFSILVPFAGTYGMGDANFDESIDFADLLIVAQNYGTETSGSFDVGDFNLDGSVNFTDLLAIAQNYGDVFAFESDWQAARGMVPEPNFVGGLIGIGLMLRRRSR